MVLRNAHVQSAAAVAQVFGSEHGTLLANQECSTIGVTSDIVRADGQIGDLQALDAVHVEALVQNTVLDDAVTLLGGHRARAERVPGSLDVAL